MSSSNVYVVVSILFYSPELRALARVPRVACAAVSCAFCNKPEDESAQLCNGVNPNSLLLSSLVDLTVDGPKDRYVRTLSAAGDQEQVRYISEA